VLNLSPHSVAASFAPAQHLTNPVPAPWHDNLILW
jgi:hypothetical protein